MNASTPTPCRCVNCPGAACTCGCQQPAPTAQPATCGCGPQCQCGPSCRCATPR